MLLEADSMVLLAVVVDTPAARFTRHTLRWEAPSVSVLDRDERVLAAGTVAEATKPTDQSWRFVLADGQVWDVQTARGCNCGSQAAVIPK